jgi:hypothetical protein
MSLFEEDDVLKLGMEAPGFYYWAIQEHAAYACQELEVEPDVFIDILHDYVDYQDTIEAAYNERDNHLEIALGMFRYYIQKFRRQAA